MRELFHLEKRKGSRIRYERQRKKERVK